MTSQLRSFSRMVQIGILGIAAAMLPATIHAQSPVPPDAVLPDDTATTSDSLLARPSELNRSLSASAVSSAWIAQGPSPMLSGQVENILPNNEVVGAIHTIAAHPTNADVLYVGAVNGGIWRTTNATAASPTWTPLTDSLSSLSIGALEFDPANSNRLLAGIGRFSSLARLGGALAGLLLTTNGGDTWQQITHPLLVGENFSGVAVRDNLLLASSNAFFGVGGLFRSVNGGTDCDSSLRYEWLA